MIYVYAPSKTGTTSVKRALEKASIEVVRVNYLHPESIELERKTIEQFYLPVGVEGHFPHLTTLISHQKHKNEILSGKHKIITVRRDIEDRQVSRFFNNIGRMYEDFRKVPIKKLKEDFKKFRVLQDDLYINYWKREYLSGAFMVDIDNINNKDLSKFVGRKVVIGHDRKGEDDYYSEIYKKW